MDSHTADDFWTERPASCYTSVDVRCVLGVLSSRLNVNTMPSVFLVIAFSTSAD